MPPAAPGVNLDTMAAQPAIASALRTIPLFNHCDAHEIERAATLLQSRTVPPGTRITSTDLTTNTYLVVTGEARAERDDAEPLRLAHGDLFGLLRFAVDEVGLQTATTLTTTHLLVADEAASTQLLRIEGIAQTLVHRHVDRRRAQIE
jgi:CRP-like cAMP-binding protein